MGSDEDGTTSIQKKGSSECEHLRKVDAGAGLVFNNVNSI
jgi:hypothetical protein